jgi:hypothetical protein
MFVGNLNNIQMLNAHVLISNLFALIYSIPFGLNGALCILTSKAIGKN